MVKPAKDIVQGLHSKTLVDRLAAKFDILQLAREERNAPVFDEVSRSIEILLKGRPTAYNTLIQEKNDMYQDLQHEYEIIRQRAQLARDVINEKKFFDDNVESAGWEFRFAYEEVVMEIFEKFNLIRDLNYGQPSVDVVSEKPVVKAEPVREEVEEEPKKQEQPEGSLRDRLRKKKELKA